MALPKKGTRKLTVNQVSYRWLVRRQGPLWFRVIVEGYTEPKEQLVAMLSAKIFHHDHRPEVVSPQVVRQIIEVATEAGYQVDKPGGTFRFEVKPGMINLSKVNTDELVKRPVGRPRKRAPGEKRRPVYLSLEAEDRARLERVALRQQLPIGTLAKSWVLQRLHMEEQRL